MTIIKLDMPYPPTVNTYYRAVNGRNIMSKKGRQYKKDCAVLIKRPKSPLTGDAYLTIDATMPDKRRRDIDNILKPILDALTDCGIYEDDSQVVELTIRKSSKIVKGGGIKIFLHCPDHITKA